MSSFHFSSFISVLLSLSLPFPFPSFSATMRWAIFINPCPLIWWSVSQGMLRPRYSRMQPRVKTHLCFLKMLTLGHFSKWWRTFWNRPVILLAVFLKVGLNSPITRLFCSITKNNLQILLQRNTNNFWLRNLNIIVYDPVTKSKPFLYCL